MAVTSLATAQQSSFTNRIHHGDFMFYGWTKIDAFFEAWRSAGFQPVGHIVFRKQ